MAQNQEEAPQKSSKMKLIIFLVVGLVVLGGGGFAAYLFFFKKEPPAEATDHASPHAQHAPAVAQPVMYQMDPFLVNLSDPGGKRYLKLTMQLSMENTAAQTDLQNRMVVVRDSVIMMLSGKTFEEISSPAGKMALKREIMAKVNKTLTQGQVKEIFFTEFLVQ